MRKYRVIISGDARADLKTIHADNLEFYENIETVLKIENGILDRISKLCYLSEGLQVRMTYRGKKIRFAHSGRYVIAYYVKKREGSVVVQRILHSRRDVFGAILWGA